MENNQVKEVKEVKTETNEKETKKDKIKRILIIPEIIIIVLLFAISIFSIMSSKNNGLAKDPIFGLSFMPVRSDSMAGGGKDNFVKGDFLIAKEVKDVSTLKVGDIITYKVYQGDNYYLETHRIVEIKEDGSIYTQGDNTNMSFVPSKVENKNILAIYKGQIKKVGNFFLFFEDRTNYAIFILIPLLILMLWNIYGFVKALLDYRRKAMIDKAVASGEISEELKALAIQEYLAKQKALAEQANAEPAKEEKHETNAEANATANAEANEEPAAEEGKAE